MSLQYRNVSDSLIMGRKLAIMDTTKELGFVAACKEFFGFAPGQTLMSFRDECKLLTPKDQEEIRAGLLANGLNVKPLQS